MQSSLADLTAAKIVANYPIPPFGPLRSGIGIQQPSTDPNVFMSDPNYQKQLNEQSAWDQAVDTPNIYAQQRFLYVCQQWELNKNASSIPKPIAPWLPAQYYYRQFVPALFDKWWTMFCAAPGQDPPPLFFVTPLYPLDANGNPVLPPDIEIVAATPTVVPGDGPVGPAKPANQTTYFGSSSLDDSTLYPDQSIYAGTTGTFQKHIYVSPFADPTKGYQEIVWIRIGPAAPAVSSVWKPIVATAAKTGGASATAATSGQS